MEEDLGTFHKALETCSKNLTPLIEKYVDFPELPEGFDVLNEEVKYIKNDIDKESFDQVLDLMGEGEYTNANIILQCMSHRYIPENLL